MKRPTSRRDTPAEIERLTMELAEERERTRRLENELGDARRMEALGRLAGGMAHDFSNILAVINGHCELVLKRMDPTDPLRSGLESIRKAAAWGLNLTQQMITTSRAAPAAPASLEVNAVVSSVVRALVPLLGDDIQVAVEPDPAAGRVQANSGQLEQSLMNLLLNARDAMPSGGRLLVQTGTATLDQLPGGPRPAVVIRVTDTGCGMDAATLARAFEPYFTTKAPGKGSGLGLATVFAFVTQHGGHVDAVSEPGQGSTFTIYLPREDVDRTLPPAVSVQTPTVMVVEPEAGVRELIAEILELHGYHVLSARDSDEADALGRAHPGALALLIADLLAPGVAGDALLQRLGPTRAATHILYLSGDLQDTVAEHRGVGPGRAFLHKPFTVDALVQKVREIIGG